MSLSGWSHCFNRTRTNRTHAHTVIGQADSNYLRCERGYVLFVQILKVAAVKYDVAILFFTLLVNAVYFSDRSRTPSAVLIPICCTYETIL